MPKIVHFYFDAWQCGLKKVRKFWSCGQENPGNLENFSPQVCRHLFKSMHRPEIKKYLCSSIWSKGWCDYGGIFIWPRQWQNRHRALRCWTMFFDSWNDTNWSTIHRSRKYFDAQPIQPVCIAMNSGTQPSFQIRQWWIVSTTVANALECEIFRSIAMPIVGLCCTNLPLKYSTGRRAHYKINL